MSSSFFDTLKHLVGLDKKEQFEPAIAYRDKKTGRYVSRYFAEQHPLTTQKEVY
jgi:hypothetical protein